MKTAAEENNVFKMLNDPPLHFDGEGGAGGTEVRVKVAAKVAAGRYLNGLTA